MIDVTAATLTLERFAALDMAWPETITLAGGVLLARIHPRNNRPHGDEEVLARALAFIPPRTFSASFGEEEFHREGYLARVTIRTTDLNGSDYGMSYAALLKAVLALPVIELS